MLNFQGRYTNPHIWHDAAGEGCKWCPKPDIKTPPKRKFENQTIKKLEKKSLKDKWSDGDS